VYCQRRCRICIVIAVKKAEHASSIKQPQIQDRLKLRFFFENVNERSKMTG